MNYRFIGTLPRDHAGASVASAGDVDGDGRDDVIIGAWRADGGEAYLATAADLDAADAADGSRDGAIRVEALSPQASSYRFVGEELGDAAGDVVASAGDVDGDGRADLLVGAPFNDPYRGAAYLVTAADLAAADAADGTAGGSIRLGNVAAQPGSYKFVGEGANDMAGRPLASAGDVDADGRDDLIVGAWQAGGAYLVPAAALAAADAADGLSDGVIGLGHVAGLAGAYRFDVMGESAVASAGDVDGDGRADLILGAQTADGGGSNSGEAYLALAADLAAADAADGLVDGVVGPAHLAAQSGSYRFVGGAAGDFAGCSVAAAGDVDGDGRADLLIGAQFAANASGPFQEAGAAYLAVASDLAAADAADGTEDGVIDLERLAAQPGSYKFAGTRDYAHAGYAVSSAGDVDGDGLADLLIGAPGGGTADAPGDAFLATASDLAAADAADGRVDGVIALDSLAGQTTSYRFVGADRGDGAGISVASAGDVDGDGRADLLIGASEADGGGLDSGEAYLLVARLLGQADAADGAVDGIIDLGRFDDVPAVARDDALSTGDTTMLTGASVFADNGSGPDTDPDSPLTVTAVNGAPADVGQSVELASGALLTLTAGGALTYDPNGMFEYLPLGASATDSFTYQLNAQAVATVTVAIDGMDNDDVFEGTADADAFHAGSGDDALAGHAGDDTLDGGAGSDTLAGGAGDDWLDGGDGRDTAVFSGGRSAYTLRVSASEVEVQDRRADGDATDRLARIETVAFADQTWPLDRFSGVAGLAECDFRAFVEFYVAYFDRAPDAEGLFFWATAYANGFSLEAMAADWLTQPEYAATYPPGLSNAAFAETVYQNVLGRASDPLGFAFWVDVLDSGAVGRDTFILEVLKGAKAPPPPGADPGFVAQKIADRDYLSDKTDIGIYFAATKGMSDVDDAADVMARFDGSEASKTAAAAAVDGHYQDALEAGSGDFLLQLVGVADDPFA